MRSCFRARKMTLTMATRQWCDVTRCSLIYCFILYIAFDSFCMSFGVGLVCLGFYFLG